MLLVDVKTMRNLEKQAIEDFGVPSLLLMENAATGALFALLSEIKTAKNKSVHVFCGKGNNGGDGFALARMLQNCGADVKITLLGKKEDITGDAKVNLEICEKMKIPFASIKDCKNADIIIDAIFGTGFYGEAEGEFKDAISAINESNAFVLSVDIPSGISADTGCASKFSVYADLVVTFSAIKLGHLLFPGKDYYKKLVKTNISVPQSVINNTMSGYDVIDKNAVSFLPKRHENSHKGSFGKALAYVGSCGMSGAAILSSCAVLKSGAGVLKTAVPKDIYEIVAKRVPSSMVFPIETDALFSISNELSSCDVLLAGCGLGTDLKTKDTLFDLIKTFDKKMVLDADALNLVAQSPEVLKNSNADIVITPHIAEFSRLSKIPISSIKENPVKHAREFALEYGVTVILKDAVTVISSKTGHIYISATSNSGMATAGSGDVLAGIITGILAQGQNALKSAVCGVYLHLLAGEIAKQKTTEYSMTSEDLLNALPDAIKSDVDILQNIKEL